ncbi:sensor histidine kinase [Anaerocolumna aminovalerica]|uniref:sensor histidine kinase n=1 Tax=Anaerocolumna aminovalerica TaxID=1527 RepID=UPI00248B61F1|nr:histidine kinase [Anaerocolumna aminovalerica]
MHKKKSKQLYYKIFFTYTAILVFTVGVLMVYFISSNKARIFETNLDYMKMLSEEAVSYMEECSNDVGYIKGDLYQLPVISEDLLNYLRYDEETYQVKRLEKYIASTTLKYNGFESFIIKNMETYSNILQIDLISYLRLESTSCYSDGIKNRTTLPKNKIDQIRDGDLAGRGRFSFLKELRDPDTMESVGCMIVIFKADVFDKLQNYYSKAELAVYNMEGTAVYNSLDDYSEKEVINLEKDNEYSIKKTVKDYVIYTFIDKNQARQLPMSLLLTIFGVGVTMIIIGEMCINIYLQKLTGRLNYILDGMNKITTGDLSVRLEVDNNGDELDLISKNFNDMCVKLDRYIQRSYLAEIEQKNAELEALQDQINPHFLYNTLESIRMKAICNGDKDVAKMLYSMAVIFRSQLKESDVITVIQEIHYCKKYLELFEFRYQGKFTSTVICPEEYMNYPIIKFILQPVIENYFVHGIRGESEGNEICILVESDEDALIINVIDNGRGMSDEEIEAKNKELMENKRETKKSIGLINVNGRLKAVYGEEYGVLLKSSDSGGMHIILRVGMGEENGNEKSNVN